MQHLCAVIAELRQTATSGYHNKRHQKALVIYVLIYLFFRNIYLPPKVETRWSCGICHAWGKVEVNVFCRYHEIWNTKPENVDIRCISQLEAVLDNKKPGPLRVMYYNFCSQHGMYRYLQTIWAAISSNIFREFLYPGWCCLWTDDRSVQVTALSKRVNRK